MLSTPLEAQYKTTVHLRPVRIAYFIPEADIVAFERAASVATTQWGGLHNIIVPVRNTTDFLFRKYYQYLLKLFEPEIFVSYSGQGAESEAFRSAVLSQLRKMYPWRSVELQSAEEFEQADNSVHALSVIPDTEKSAQTLILPKAVGWSSAANAALFGKIYRGQEETYNSQFAVFAQNFETAREVWDAQFYAIWYSSPINTTTYHLGPLLVTNGIESNAFDIVFWRFGKCALFVLVDARITGDHPFPQAWTANNSMSFGDCRGCGKPSSVDSFVSS